MSLEAKYEEKCNTFSDIFLHLPVLRALSETVNHITELGVRGVVSSYAFVTGLYSRPNTKLVQCDLVRSDEVDIFHEECRKEGFTNVVFYEGSDLECPREETDLLFIDTFHCYGQLVREFAYWHSYVRKYIVLHDTTIDGWKGEVLRSNSTVEEVCEQTKMTEEEVTVGLLPAVYEFLSEHPEWTMKEQIMHNNGLTILEKID